MSNFCLRKEGQQNICFLHAKSTYFIKIRRHYCISLDIYTTTPLITSMFVEHTHIWHGQPVQRTLNTTHTAHRASTIGELSFRLLYQITSIKSAVYVSVPHQLLSVLAMRNGWFLSGLSVCLIGYLIYILIFVSVGWQGECSRMWLDGWIKILVLLLEHLNNLYRAVPTWTGKYNWISERSRGNFVYSVLTTIKNATSYSFKWFVWYSAHRTPPLEKTKQENFQQVFSVLSLFEIGILSVVTCME